MVRCTASAVEPLGGIELERAVSPQHVTEQTSATMLARISDHDPVKTILRADRLRHDFAEDGEAIRAGPPDGFSHLGACSLVPPAHGATATAPCASGLQGWPKPSGFVESVERMKCAHGELRIGFLDQDRRTLISDVVMARMLIPLSDKALNAFAATPAWERMPTPMAETFTTSVSP